MKNTIIGSILFVAILHIIGVSSCTQPSSNKNEEKTEMSKAEIAARQANKEWFAEMDKMENDPRRKVHDLQQKLEAIDDIVNRYNTRSDKGYFESDKDYYNKLDEEAKALGIEGVTSALDLAFIQGSIEAEIKDQKKKEEKKLKEIQDEKKEVIDYYEKCSPDEYATSSDSANASNTDSFSWCLKRKLEIKKEIADLCAEQAKTGDINKIEAKQTEIDEQRAKIQALDKKMKELKSKNSKK